MSHHLVPMVTSWLNQFMPNEAIVFVISVLPILELRGGLIAASLFGIPWYFALPICILGSMAPVPFILLFINKLFDLLKKTKLKKFIIKIEEHGLKASNKIKKYQSLGLFVFAALPLPGAGAWTSALIAALLRMKVKKASILIFLGTIAAGLIMAVISYVIPAIYRHCHLCSC